MKKLAVLFAVLAAASLVSSAYGFKITNVTNDEVVFQCSYETGLAGENVQIDTPEIGTWDFRGYYYGGTWVLGDSQVHNWVEDAVTNLDGITPYYGDLCGRIEPAGNPRPHSTAILAGTPSAVGDLMRIECAYIGLMGATGIRLYESLPDMDYPEPDFRSVGSVYLIGDPGVAWDVPWDLPACLMAQGDNPRYQWYEDAHTVGQWSEVMIEYVNGSTDIDVTVDGTLYIFTNMRPYICNYVAFGSVGHDSHGYLDAIPEPGALSLLILLALSLPKRRGLTLIRQTRD